MEVPENVVLLFLPAYSPELNPVERLWRTVRARIDVFDERIQSRLEVLREHVAEIVRGLRAVEVARLTRYNYIKAALNALRTYAVDRDDVTLGGTLGQRFSLGGQP